MTIIEYDSSGYSAPQLYRHLHSMKSDNLDTRQRRRWQHTLPKAKGGNEERRALKQTLTTDGNIQIEKG